MFLVFAFMMSMLAIVAAGHGLINSLHQGQFGWCFVFSVLIILNFVFAMVNLAKLTGVLAT